MIISENFPTPPMWAEYEDRIQIAAFTSSFAPAAVVNRFRARYRFARSFEGLMMSNYKEPTIRGYSALTKLTLHWTALEQLKRALSIESDSHFNISPELNEVILNKLRQINSSNKFFRYLKTNIKHWHETAELNKFISNQPCKVLSLAKSTRHIFLHGQLTPNADGSDPADIVKICDLLSEFITEVMDTNFKTQVENLVQIVDELYV